MLGTILAAILTVFPSHDTDEGFADYLYGHGEYGLASVEYLRIIYAYDEDTLACPLVSLRLARCWQELGREDVALRHYRQYVEARPNDNRTGTVRRLIRELEEAP